MNYIFEYFKGDNIILCKYNYIKRESSQKNEKMILCSLFIKKKAPIHKY